MGKNWRKVREFCQSRKVGTMTLNCMSLSPAFNELGYNEHPIIMSNFLSEEKKNTSY